MTQSQSRENKSAVWRERLEEAKNYAGSLTQYCAAGGFSYAQLHYWRGKLGTNGPLPGSRGGASAMRVAPAFVRVEQCEPSPAPCDPAPTSYGASFVAEVLWHMSALSQGVRP